jgi:tetratricopeptide (TPR) repeat protein
MQNCQAGPCWKYKTRRGEESSRAIVLGTNEIPNFGAVARVALINLHIVEPNSTTGFAEWIRHLPITKSALDESVTELHIEPPLVPRQLDTSGYAEWLSTLETGDGVGVWMAPLSEIVQAIEGGLTSDPLTETEGSQSPAADDRNSILIRQAEREDLLPNLNEATLSQPDDAEASTSRGIARRDRGNLEGAVQDFEEAIRLRPDVAARFYNCGLVRQTQGNLEGAFRDFDEAIQLDPNDADRLRQSRPYPPR